MEYEYVSEKGPGPGNYNPRQILPKLRQNKFKPEDYIKKSQEKLKTAKEL